MGNLAPPFTGGPDPRRGVLPDVKGLERFIALADSDPEAARKLLAGLAAKQFEPHPGQQPVMDAHERFLTLCAGRRLGKTKLAAALVLRKCRRERKMVWWVAPTYKVVKQVGRASCRER